MGNFAKALRTLWKNEFGDGPHYEHSDQWTNWGLIEDDLRAAIAAGIVGVGTQLEDLTEDEATEITRWGYWDSYRLDEVPEPQAGKVFDTAVCLNAVGSNSGVAIRLWQQALNEAANAQIAQDGVCGPKTRLAARHAMLVSKDASVLARYRELLVGFREWQVRKDPGNKKWEKGWIARAKR